MAAEIGELELCGGSASGRLGFDLSQTRIKASLVGSLTDVDIDPCLKPLALDIPLKGVGTLKTDVMTEGETIDEIVRSLSGDLKIKAQNGAVPVDFAQLLTASTPLEGDGWSQKNLTPFRDARCRLPPLCRPYLVPKIQDANAARFGFRCRRRRYGAADSRLELVGGKSHGSAERGAIGDAPAGLHTGAVGATDDPEGGPPEPR